MRRRTRHRVVVKLGIGFLAEILDEKEIVERVGKAVVSCKENELIRNILVG